MSIEPPAPLSAPKGRGRPPVSKDKQYREAVESQKAMERKKQQIGIGLDRGGVTLANAKRRQGLIDDEDFEMVVDEDD